MKYGRESSDIAFWHEPFAIRAGECDEIYVNFLPLGLRDSQGVKLVPAYGNMATAAGRAGSKKTIS